MSNPEKDFEAIEREEANREQVEEKQQYQRPLHTVDLSQLTPQTHRWVDRGAVMSCEGAGHTAHRTFKIAR